MSQKQSNTKKSTTVRHAEQAKAGKRKRNWQRPPSPARSGAELEARALRRARLNGAFGRYTSDETYNFLITGTKGRPRMTRAQLDQLAHLISKNNKGITEAA